ncbi:MAG: AAA family ATPase, partial [Thermoleophilaceae bacterium]
PVRRQGLRRPSNAAYARRRDAERAAEAARGEAAAAGAELAAVNQFLRSSAGPGGSIRALSDQLEVEPGYELALAAALGPRLGGAVVEDLGTGEELLDKAGDDGAFALLARAAPEERSGAAAPVPEARRLLDCVRAEGAAAGVAERLLGSVWVVESLAEVPKDFDGVAVTRAGRVLEPDAGELRQAPAGGAERVLEERNRRVALVAASREALRAEADARAAVERAGQGLAAADLAREEADTVRRLAQRELEQAVEAVRRTEWQIERRREAPEGGPDAVRQAELTADLRAERLTVQSALRQRDERRKRALGLRARIDRDAAVGAAAERAGAALASAAEAVGARVAALEAERAAGAETGEQTAAALRACAHEEAGLQSRLRTGSERVTAAEVSAQQVRDSAADAEAELREVAAHLGLEPEAAPDALDEEVRAELAGRIERLGRRREQLGPVNPLAASEYEEAVAHVEELEAQRSDLEGALAELQRLIRETDRRIRDNFEQTFEAAARNFQEVVEHLFPGGRGRLRLVRPDQAPRPVLGGQDSPDEEAEPPEAGTEADGEPAVVEAGVEVEVTPAGKSTKRLSLLSGGEKSLVALAFMFAVFLARPCPFYILDEVEAALDDPNIDRFLQLVRRYSDRAQFIVVTHQKRTMDAADRLYGVSMGGDGVSRVVSRKLAAAEPLTGTGAVPEERGEVA